MKIVNVNAYSYSELSEKAKDKVKEWLNSSGIDDIFDDCEREYQTEELKELGYSDIDIQYSGFGSQGDGASIACMVDVLKFLDRSKLLSRFSPVVKLIRKNDVNTGVKIIRSTWGHYVHEKLLYSNTADFEEQLFPDALSSKAISNQIEAIGRMILEEVQEKSRELYKSLEANYDFHFTDEYMIDVCDSNEYLFDKYGNPIHNLVAV